MNLGFSIHRRCGGADPARRPPRPAGLAAAVVCAAAAWLPGVGSPLAALEVRDIFGEPRLEGTRPQQHSPSPDGGRVAFFWNPEGGEEPLDLYVVRAAGGKAERWSDLGAERFFEPRKQAWPRRPPLGGADWSADGGSLVFSYRGELFVADGRGPARRLTRTRTLEREPRWLPRSRSIIFLRGGAVGRLDLGTSAIADLTDLDDPAPTLLSAEVSPDGARVLVTAQDSKGQDEVLIPYYLDEAVSTRTETAGMTPFRVGLLDSGGGEVRWVDPGDEAIGSLNRAAWAPDGRRVLIDSTAPDLKRRTLRVVDASSLEVRVVQREEDPYWIEVTDDFASDEVSTRFSSDGGEILFLSERSGFRQAWAVAATGGEARQLTREDGEVTWAAWTAGAQSLVILSNGGVSWERHLVRLGSDGRRERIDPGTGAVNHPRLSRDGRRLAYLRSAFDVPADLWSAPSAAGTPVRLSDSAPERFKQVRWSVPELVSFAARDGVTLRGLVYAPHGHRPGQRHPAVVFVHGAGIQQNVLDGWTIYSPNFKFHHLLAGRGFLVFEVDYRGSTGYGRDFRGAVQGHLGGKDFDDELAGVDYLRGRGDVDPARIGIYGGSYGGFMALMGLFREPELFAAGAALRFVADWRSYHRGNPWYCRQRLGDPGKEPEAYRRSSPIEFADGLRGPLLLLHGVLDSNVPFQDCVRLVDRLVAAGKKPELMIYPREDHGFTEAASWIDQYERVLGFFERHLQAGSPPAVAAPAGAGAPR